ncbi:MAG: sigma 54-interacting transcriptional regulator [Nannocystaceae bacterium]
MGTLVLGDVDEALWSAYQSRRLGESRALAERAGLVVDRWDRSRRLGAPPEGLRRDDHLLRGEALRARAERLELLRVLGAGSLGLVARELAERDHVLLLADPDGVVVEVDGGGAFADEARRVLLIEGACWSEAARGTNAIGTAAAEAQPIAVVGRAHFARDYHDLSCVAAPIRDVDGSVRAVLDATSSAGRGDPAVATAVLATARALERLLWLEAYAGAGAGVRRVLSGALDHIAAAALLIEPPGRIERANRAAQALLGPAVGEPCGAALGLSWAALAAEATSPTAGGLPVALAGGGAARLRAEPIVAARGGVLAVLAYLEPAHPRARRDEAATSPRAAGVGAGAIEAASVDPFASIFAEDPAVLAQLRWARQLAGSELPVMLLAETGAGKELIARAIHDASPRAAGPFIAINCGALTPSLLESELFGHGPSAFTGADRRGRDGLLHAASGGTLFLDEVAEMAPAMQAALLRVLEGGVYYRVGEVTPRRADVRLVCATCRDLPARIAAGEFRKDLYYRLRGGVITLPPLRERGDVIALAEHLLARLCARDGARPTPRLSPAAAARLRRHGWPGNVRELRSCLEVALVLGRDVDALGPEHLPPDLEVSIEAPAPASARAPAPGPTGGASLEAIEARAVEAAVEAAGGNLSAAARSLGIARSTLYRRLRRREG